MFIAVCYLISLKDDKELSKSYFRSEVSNQLGKVYRLYPIVSATFLFVVTFFKKQKLLEILTMFYRLDKKAKINYFKIRTFICFTSTFMFLFQLLMIISFMYHIEVEATFAVLATSSLPPFCIWMYILVYITFAYIIKEFIAKFNENIEKMRRLLPNGYYVVQVDVERSEKYLSEVSKMHDMLSDIFDDFQEYFGIKMLLIIGLSFIYIIFVIYYGLELCFSPTDFEGLDRTGLFVLI